MATETVFSIRPEKGDKDYHYGPCKSCGLDSVQAYLNKPETYFLESHSKKIDCSVCQDKGGVPAPPLDKWHLKLHPETAIDLFYFLGLEDLAGARGEVLPDTLIKAITIKKGHEDLLIRDLKPSVNPYIDENGVFHGMEEHSNFQPVSLEQARKYISKLFKIAQKAKKRQRMVQWR